MTLFDLPLINAILNGTSTILLIGAFAAIKRRRFRTHAWLMSAAIFASLLFLTGYITYHRAAGEKSTAGMHGLPHWLRSVYLSILFPHILLAFVMVPMIGIALWRALTRQWPGHQRIARPTWWVWMYVSVTGVIIYWMLYHLFPGVVPAHG